MAANKLSGKPSQIVLWSLPRSGCHLLEKVLFSKQDNLKYCWHPYEPSVLPQHMWLSSDGIEDESDANRNDYATKSAEAGQKWKAALKEAQDADQTLYMHEHALFAMSPQRILDVISSPTTRDRPDHKLNFTTVPDDILLYPGTIPLITIRHPGLTVPSNYRAASALYTGAKRSNWILNTGLAWYRDLYDYYKAHGIEPIVADSDDYMSSEVFVRHLAGRVGLDPAKAIVSWPKATEEEKQKMHPMLLQIQDSLVNSEGIKADRASKNLDLEAEREKWKNEFDPERLKLIEEMVDIAMPHYKYLRGKRLQT